MQEGKNIYSSCQGVAQLRDELAKKITKFNHYKVNPETEIMVSHGATGAFVCAVKTLFNPGDEVILFEPFYGYHKHILEVCGYTVKAIPINLDDLSVDLDELKRVISTKTKGIVICTPNNPTGKVFSKQELITIGEIADKYDLTIITDEIYEYFTYPGFEHYSIASLGFQHRTLTISGFSKTFNMTGWRLGYVSGPDFIIEKMSLLQDLLYACPVTPLQYGALAGLQVQDDYYQNLRFEFLVKRDHMTVQLREIGFKLPLVQGAYYILANVKPLRFANSDEAFKGLLEEAKVAVVPGSSFYLDPRRGSEVVRICFALKEEVLGQALHQIKESIIAQQ
jgi:aminotransferase